MCINKSNPKKGKTKNKQKKKATVIVLCFDMDSELLFSFWGETSAEKWSNDIVCHCRTDSVLNMNIVSCCVGIQKTE